MIKNFDNKSLEELKIEGENKLFFIHTFGCPLV
jgi:hypothetical protein